MAKRTKYSNGGLHIKKSFNTVGDIESTVGAGVSGDQKYQRGTLSLQTKKNGFTIRGEMSRDSYGNKNTNVKASKKITPKLTVGVESNPKRKYTGLFFEKQL